MTLEVVAVGDVTLDPEELLLMDMGEEGSRDLVSDTGEVLELGELRDDGFLERNTTLLVTGEGTDALLLELTLLMDMGDIGSEDLESVEAVLIGRFVAPAPLCLPGLSSLARHGVKLSLSSEVAGKL